MRTLFHKLGAEAKVITPAEVISSSDPETEKLNEFPSSSEPVIVPIEVWFSSPFNVADDVNTGASFTSVTLTVMD